jgi:hypothetical protein
MLDHRAYERLCALQVAIDQVVDDHVHYHVGNQQDQQDRHLAAELINHHHPAEDQD